MLESFANQGQRLPVVCAHDTALPLALQAGIISDLGRKSRCLQVSLNLPFALNL
jgi:hypothetical protein